MKWTLFAALLLLAGAGCQPKDRAAIADEGSKAWNHAASAAMTAWSSVSKKVAEVTPEASAAVMKSARDAAEAARQKLAAIPDPTPDVRAKIEAVQAGLAKIDAAATLKELQEKSASMVEAAKQQAENAGKTYEEVRDGLRRANATFRELDEKTSKARDAYDDATRRLGLAESRSAGENPPKPGSISGKTP